MASLSPKWPDVAGNPVVQPIRRQGLENVIERKYAIRMPNTSSFVDTLGRYVARDPLFPTGIVNTIYYDTPDLQAYRESHHGFYRRTKVRLRWYSDVADTAGEDRVRCYLEVKRRNGRIRSKARFEVEVSADDLGSSPLRSLEVLRLGQLASGLMSGIPRLLVPTLLIRYHRDRFFDLVSHSRMAVDQNISCSGRSGSSLPGRPLSFPVGIFEIKGESGRLPQAVRPLTGYLGRVSSGKYVYFCSQLLRPPLRAIRNG